MLAYVLLVMVGPLLGAVGVALISDVFRAGSTTSSLWLGIFFLAIPVLSAAWFTFDAELRELRHRASVRKRGSAAELAGPPARDPSLTWMPNQAAPARSRHNALIAAGLSLAGAAAIVAWYAVFGSLAFLYTVALIAGFLLGIAGVFAFFGSRTIASPSAIALANDGIHFWYDSPYDQQSQTPLMSWTQLNLLGLQGPALGDPAKRLIRMFRIDPENARHIADEWQRHRLVSPPPLKAAPSGSGPQPVLAPPPTPAGAILAARTGTGSRGGLSVACARCHVRFPGLEGFRLLWCKVDHFYVCRRCWEDGCQEGHGKGVKARSKPARIATAVVVAALFFALFYPNIAYDFTLRNVWTSAPVSPISGLRAGQVVKVQGVIAPGPDIAIGGYEVSSKYGWYWEWDTNDVFTILDPSGTITVSTAEWYIYYNGPVPAPNAVHVAVGDYIPGDTIQVVGTVVQGAGGGLELLAQIVSEASAVPLITLAPSPMSGLLMWVIPFLVVAILVIGIAFFAARRIRHRRATRGQPAYSIREESEVRDPRLEWQPNGKGTNPRRRAALALAAVAVGLFLLGFYSADRPQAAYGNGGFWFAGLIVLILETALVYILLFGGVGRPRSVAVADDGFHMWFDSPYDRHLNDTIFPWHQIQKIFLTRGKSSHWVLRWTTGETTNLYMLKGSNLNLLLQEWTRRNIGSST